jgi:hypothetical protein
MTSFLAVLSRLKNTLPEEPEIDSRSVFLLPFDKDLRVESEDETLPPFIIDGPLLFISGLISVTLVSWGVFYIGLCLISLAVNE